jgi:hypothetical protein
MWLRRMRDTITNAASTARCTTSLPMLASSMRLSIAVLLRLGGSQRPWHDPSPPLSHSSSFAAAGVALAVRQRGLPPQHAMMATVPRGCMMRKPLRGASR